MNPATTKTGVPPSTQLQKQVLRAARLLLVWLGLVFFGLHSTAATVTITAENFRFSPVAVTIGVGDSVSFNNIGGDHNVTGYNPAPPPERFCGTTIVGPGPMCLVTFTNTGVFPFRCVPHSSGSGTNFSGMVGSITVTSSLAIATVVPSQSYLVVGGDLTLSLSQTLNPSTTYQWQFNGTNLPGATGPTLVLSDVTTNDSGLYRVTLSSAFEVVTTPPAVVQVVDRLTIFNHPRNTNAPAGSNVTLSVTAVSPLPVTYQWQRHSTNVPGATNSSLSFTNVQYDPHTGDYRVLVSDTTSNVWSETATLLVLIRPVITNQPVALTVLQGGTAIFTVTAGPNHPLNPLAYRWLRGGIPILTSTVPMLVLTNVQSNTTIRVAITNLSTGPGGTGSGTVNLTVLPDMDRDGMADAWETLYGFDTNNVADGALDSDGDGMNNRDEYSAGNNPTNTASVFKLQMAHAGEATALSFLAISNRTYTVEWNTQVTEGPWNRLQDVLAQPFDRIESVIDTNANGAKRFYRAVTPRRP